MGGRASIPGEFFDNVDHHDGFVVIPNDTYILELDDKWEYNQDDCGHEINEDTDFSAEPDNGPELVVLKRRANG